MARVVNGKNLVDVERVAPHGVLTYCLNMCGFGNGAAETYHLATLSIYVVAVGIL